MTKQQKVRPISFSPRDYVTTDGNELSYGDTGRSRVSLSDGEPVVPSIVYEPHNLDQLTGQPIPESDLVAMEET